MTPALTFRERLTKEFDTRRALNKRYSLRAFASLLDVDHATLSQILRAKRSVPVERIGSWARKLKLMPEEAAVYAAVARIADENARSREEQLRHWAAEMLALLTQPAHREILRLSRLDAFRADSRWLAGKIGISVDEVNIALTRLLRLKFLEINADGLWLDKTGLSEISAQSFRRYVAERVASPPDEIT